MEAGRRRDRKRTRQREEEEQTAESNTLLPARRTASRVLELPAQVLRCSGELDFGEDDGEEGEPVPIDPFVTERSF